DTLAVAAKTVFTDADFFSVIERDVDATYGRGLGTARGSGDSGDADSNRGRHAPANPMRQGFGHFAADRAFFFDQLFRHIGELGFRGVGIDDRSAWERSGAA